VRRVLILLLLIGCGGGSGSSLTDPSNHPPQNPGDPGTPGTPGDSTPGTPGDSTPSQPGDSTPGQPGDSTHQPGPVALMSVISGGTQTAQVATELPQAIAVRATDAESLPVPQQIINFVVVSGGGSVFAGTAQTNSQGEARERWTLGPTAGEQVLEARAVDPTTGDPIVFSRITAQASPGPVANLSFRNLHDSFLNPYELQVGDTLDLTTIVVEGVDQYGNAIWAAPDVDTKSFGTFADLQTGISFGEDPIQPGTTFVMQTPFSGFLRVYAAGQHYGDIHFKVDD
jgi:hypothetical protein